MRRLWLFALALTILLPLLAVMLALSAVSASQAQCAGGLAGAGGPVGGVPTADIPIFQGAAAEFALGDRGPSILAAINYIESTFDTSSLPGVHSGTNRAGAAGPMQIGVDGTSRRHLGHDQSQRSGRSARAAAERLRRGRRRLQRRPLPAGIRRARGLARRDLHLQPLKRLRPAGPLPGRRLLHPGPDRPTLHCLRDNRELGRGDDREPVRGAAGER